MCKLQAGERLAGKQVNEASNVLKSMIDDTKEPYHVVQIAAAQN